MNKAKEYQGDFLRFRYPDFLKVKSETPTLWYAAAPKNRACVIIALDPPMAQAEAFSRNMERPHENAVRKGSIKTPNGIEGHERVLQFNETMAWDIGAKSKQDHTIHITLWTIHDDWHDGIIWRDFINSIEVIGDPSQIDSLPKKRTKSRKKTPRKIETIEIVGVLCELPNDLHYVFGLAAELNSFNEENLEDNPELAQVLESWFQKNSALLTKQKAQEDSERLLSWLKEFPAEKYPETGPLYGAAGILFSFGFNP